MYQRLSIIDELNYNFLVIHYFFLFFEYIYIMYISIDHFLKYIIYIYINIYI
jgi:hypothetical protein